MTKIPLRSRSFRPIHLVRPFHFKRNPQLLTDMPTYEYECLGCGKPFDAVQSMKDPHLTDCPQEGCQGPVRRKISLGSGFIFKGSGFYITDYRSDSYKEAAKKDSEASTKAASSTSSGSSSDSSSSASSGSSSNSGSSSPPPSGGSAAAA